MNSMIDDCEIDYQSDEFKIEQDVFGEHYVVVVYKTSDKVYIVNSPCAGCIGDYFDVEGKSLEECIEKLIHDKAELIRGF